MTRLTEIGFQIPNAIEDYAESYAADTDMAARMRFVVDASQLNIDRQFGAPFAAAIIDRHSGQLVALGTNLVTSENLSILHAEMVAIALAQRRLGTFDLGDPQLPGYDLYTSCEPCTMCLGAIHWSGVRRVIAAARDSDAAAIGFDEGPKPANWAAALRERGLEVVIDVERQRACRVLKNFQDSDCDTYRAMRNLPCDHNDH